MSYEKTTWSSGDVITAEKLNKIETGIESNNLGYELITEYSVLVEETIDTVVENDAPSAYGTFDYQTQISADEIIVVFNNVEYVCGKTECDWGNIYGGGTEEGVDYTDYPFAITSNETSSELYTEEAGTYSVIIKVEAESMSTTSAFNAAVSSALHSGGANNALIASQVSGDNGTVLDKTWKEIYDAFMNGVAVRVACTGFDQNGEYGTVVYVKSDPYGHQYGVTFFNPAEEYNFTQLLCYSENGYPAFS